MELLFFVLNNLRFSRFALFLIKLLYKSLQYKSLNLLVFIEFSGVMQSEAIRLTLGTFKEEESYWIGVIFINHRIRARVYHNDTFSNLMQRVSFFNNLH